MRKSIWTALLSAVGLFAAAVAVLLVPTSASAVDCTIGSYPPGTQAEIAVSTNTPVAGETIEVSGQQYEANESVDIYIGGSLGAPCNPDDVTLGTFVGTAHTDGSGAFDPPVTVPAGASGTTLLVGIGHSHDKFDYASTFLQIGGTEPTGTGTGPHTPATTGFDIAILSAAAVVLISAGVLFTRGGRRKAARS